MNTLACAVLGVWGLLMASASQAASFDCSKASSNVEKTICASPPLSKLDDELAADYKGARNSTADRGKLQSDQRGWLRERNACISEDCISKAYTHRIGQLRGDPVSSVPAPVSPTEPQTAPRVTAGATSTSIASASSEQKYEQGREAREREEYVKACELYQQAVAQGNLDAEHDLGFCYLVGKAVEKNTAKGFALINNSAKRGNPRGQFMLGKLYYDGAFGIPKDESQGVELLKASAKQGTSSARQALLKLNIRYEEYKIPVAYKASEYRCPSLGLNPALATYDTAAKEAASVSEAQITKLIKNVCSEANSSLNLKAFGAGEITAEMKCLFNDVELKSILAYRMHESGIGDGEASLLLGKRCPAFYSERYASLFTEAREGAARAVEAVAAANLAKEKAAEDAKVAKALEAKKAREERERKIAEEKAFLERQRVQAIAKSGVAEKNAIPWGNWTNESGASYNTDKVCLERLVVRDQMERVGGFNAPPKGEFEKTDEYQTRVAAAKAAYERTNPADPRVGTFRDEFNGSFSPPVIRDLHYNADKELFSFNVVAASCPQISIPVTMATPLNDAKVMKQAIETMAPVVILELSGSSTLTARHIYFFSKNLQTNFKTNYPFPIDLSASNAKKAKMAVDAHHQMVASMREANMSEAQRLAAAYNKKKRSGGACDNVGNFMDSTAYSAMPENMKIMQIRELLFKAHEIGCI